MARISSQEIERLKAAGEAKRQARLEKKELEALSERLKSVARMSRVYLGYDQLTDELLDEIKALFLPGKSVAFKAKAYRMYLAEYEDLLFYSWKYENLCDAAFRFWDDVLKEPNTSFTGNSILKILGCEANHNLEILMTHHKAKFLEMDVFARVLKISVERQLANHYHSTEVMKTEKKEALENIYKLF